MKNLSAFRFPFLALSAALSWTIPLHAADPIETHWSDVCKVSAGNELVLTTLDGATADGYCMRVNVDELPSPRWTIALSTSRARRSPAFDCVAPRATRLHRSAEECAEVSGRSFAGSFRRWLLWA